MSDLPGPAHDTEGDRQSRVDRYQAIFQSCPDGILIVDPQGVIRDVNPEGLRLFAYSREALIDRSIELLVPREKRDVHVTHREGYARSADPRPMGIGLELEGLRSDGVRIPVEISLSPFQEEGES